MNSVRSTSGQFMVGARPGYSPLLLRYDVANDTNLVLLKPALLAVSLERFKSALWSRLGLKPGGPWSGQVIVTLHPAHTLDENVDISIIPFNNAWSYHLDMPDVVARTRYARALTGTLLLEIANRSNRDQTRSAELPPWLTDGLACQLLGQDAAGFALSLPTGKNDGHTEVRDAGLDPLATARSILQSTNALSFDQLSWPTDAQMNGEDGGVYLASVQLFTASLLTLDHGADKLHTMLSQLPDCLNWQTAFFAAFHADFKRPLDVEKWWSLHIVRFDSRDPGPRWTIEASRERLADLLAVPVEFRNAPGALPQHAAVSIQNAIRNFKPDELATILELKKRDFGLAEFRMATPLIALTDAYRKVITDFLGEDQSSRSNSRTVPARKSIGVAEAVKRLDALDAARREIEARLDYTAPPRPMTQATP